MKCRSKQQHNLLNHNAQPKESTLVNTNSWASQQSSYTRILIHRSQHLLYKSSRGFFMHAKVEVVMRTYQSEQRRQPGKDPCSASTKFKGIQQNILVQILTSSFRLFTPKDHAEHARLMKKITPQKSKAELNETTFSSSFFSQSQTQWHWQVCDRHNKIFWNFCKCYLYKMITDNKSTQKLTYKSFLKIYLLQT